MTEHVPTSQRYALHVGIPFIGDHMDNPNLEETLYLQVRDSTTVSDPEVFVEGDSFTVWGEPFPGEQDEFLHGVIVFTSKNNESAWLEAIRLYHDLLVYPEPVISLFASCAPPGSDLHVPFDVSTADDWSVSVRPRLTVSSEG